MFGIREELWKEKGGFNTAKEIYQQPETWLKTLQIVLEHEDKINQFFNKYEENKRTRIIFTGAGTSAYVGDIVVPYLNSKMNYRFESIPTTDIVSNPNLYLERETPTVMVSFARSGNSPESIATYNLAEQIVDDVSHIFITCNPDGEMARLSSQNENILMILMPEETNDKGFAMTSSFTNMLLASLLTFEIDELAGNKAKVEKLSQLAQSIVNSSFEGINEIVDLDYDRFVFLGSGCLKGIARESGLKILELTRGKTVSVYESILGFRHGPKSIVNDSTLIFAYMSQDGYTRKYDMDMIKELYGNPGEHKIITISQNHDEELERYSHFHWSLSEKMDGLEEVYISIVYIIYAQIFALLSSLKSGIQPDNPSPDGVVNRVVKGVTIYPYN